MAVDSGTANGVAKFLANLLNYDRNVEDDEEEFWSSLKVGTPIVNNVIVQIPSGKQYIISVKPVSGWKV